MSTGDISFIEVRDNDLIEKVTDLAREIWTEYYTPLIGKAQVEYMLSVFQSREAVTKQILDEKTRYFLIQNKKDYVGYLAVELQTESLFLSKIYIRAGYRKLGLGKESLEFVTLLAKLLKLPKITLTVNKNNTGSIQAYEKCGFKKIFSVVKDIGEGFVMDDFVMEKITGKRK